MSRISRILVPTDGSEGANKAAAYAGDLARTHGATVTVISVLEDALVMPSAWGMGAFPAGNTLTVEDIRSGLEAGLHKEVFPAAVAALGDLPETPDQAIMWGHHGEGICTYAREHGMNLIVVGSHGRSGLVRALLGSVSNFVVNHAPCPVLVIREQPTGQ